MNQSLMEAALIRIQTLILSLIICCTGAVHAQQDTVPPPVSLVIQDAHSTDIIAIDTHPFSDQLATLDRNGELVIWDMNSRMMLEKHYLGGRASAAKAIEYGANGNYVSVNTFTGNFMDLSAQSNAEIFIYNFNSEQKFNLRQHEDITSLDLQQYVIGINIKEEFGQYVTITNSGVIKQHLTDSTKFRQRMYDRRVIDVEADSAAEKVIVTLDDGSFEVLTDTFDPLWDNRVSDDIPESPGEPLVSGTEITGDRYVAYLYNLNRGEITGKDDFVLRVRELDTGRLTAELTLTAEAMNYMNSGLTSSESGRYIAAYHERNLLVYDITEGTVVYDGEIPPLASGFSNNSSAQIGALSFLKGSDKLAIARGSSLFLFDPSGGFFSSDFNTSLKPEFGGEIAAYGETGYSIFNKREGTLDLINLQNLEQQSYTSSFFSGLLKDESLIYATGKRFILPDPECSSCSGYAEYMSVNSADKTAGFWVIDADAPDDHYILTFNMENWSLIRQYGPFNTDQTTYEKVRRLEYFDAERGYVFITDSAYLDYTGRVADLEVIDVVTDRTLLTIPATSDLTVSDDGKYWMIRESYHEFRIYSMDTMLPVFSDSVYYDPDQMFNPPFYYQFREAKFYHTQYTQPDDGSLNTRLMETDLITKQQREFLDLEWITPSVFSLTDDTFYIGLDFDLTEPFISDEDTLQQLIQIHGNDVAMKDNITLIDTKTGGISDVISGAPGSYEAVVPVGDHIITKQFGGAINIYHTKNLNRPLIHYKSGRSNLFTDGDYYQSSKDLLPYIGIRYEGNVFRAEEFDLYFNRPDILIEDLAVYDPAELEAFKEAVGKRLRSNNINENSLRQRLQIETLPELTLTNLSDIPLRTSDEEIILKLSASTVNDELSGWQLSVNGVKILSEAAMKIEGRTSDWEYDLPLVPGLNRIKMSVVTTGGTRSVPVTLEVSYEPETEVQKDLYIVSIGVSDYENDLYDLKYADKDARDLQKAFAYKDTLYSYEYDWNRTDAAGNPVKTDSTVSYVSSKYLFREEIYSNIHRLTLTNDQVTRDITGRVNSFLSSSKEQDVLMVFLAGHGVINSEGDYYFGTYDIDFQDPSSAGLPYPDILSFFEGVDSRNRVLFMDTCQSGELDPDLTVESQVITQRTDSSRVSTNLQRNIGTLAILNDQPDYDSFQLMKEQFSDFDSDGTVVISAASATGFAYETEYVRNGVFTHSIIEALINSIEVNTDYSRGISVSELQNYLFKKVELLTNGKQVPTIRQENILNDFRIW